MEKEIENTLWVELEDEPFGIEIILYTDGSFEKNVYPI